MKKIREFTIYNQVVSQKNSKQIVYNKRTGKPFVMSSKRVKDWQDSALMDLAFVNPVKKGTKLYLKMKIWNKDRRPRDCDNALTSVCDVIKNAEIIEDDNCWVIQRMDVSFAGIDKESPRVEIELYELDKSEAIAKD